jgi:ribulose-phosphate 3-epimerase
MVEIVPAILEKDATSFEEKLKKVWGEAKKVQVDIIDGKFAPMETVEPEVLLNIDTIVDFEGHLMVERPEDWIERCVAAGMTGLFGQVEMMEDVVKFVADTQSAGLRVGLAYDIDTQLTDLENYINDLDAVLLMSAKAGSQGVNEFDDRVLEKIKQVRKINKRIVIVVDGGLDVDSIKKCFAAEWAEELSEDELDRNFGKMEFAVGSEIFGSEDIKEKLDELESLGAR